MHKAGAESAARILIVKQQRISAIEQPGGRPPGIFGTPRQAPKAIFL